MTKLNIIEARISNIMKEADNPQRERGNENDIN